MSTENFKNKSFKANQMSKCPFTGAGTPAKFSAGRGQTVRDFWPNSLNLKILSQHSNLSNPCLLYTSPSPRDLSTSRMPSSA